MESLGYVHMQDMSAQALDRLHLDLDAENQSREGVVIDLRNNTGGFVNAYALDVFARRALPEDDGARRVRKLRRERRLASAPWKRRRCW